MGAVATHAVRQQLNQEHGHAMVEFERYAMANKVWHTKVKRLRLPDLLCVRCGLRVESRGKSKLAVVLSHSDAAGRAWDDGGMRGEDLFAFLRVDLSADPPHTSSPVYFRTDDLRSTREHAKESGRKAISEGSELTLTWQSWTPGKSGRVIEIDEEDRIHCEWEEGGGYRYYHWKQWPVRHLYVPPGGPFIANETMVAGIVPPVGELGCHGGSWNIAEALKSDDAADQYAAIRAAGILGEAGLEDQLATIANDADEDWRIRLEASASLARMDPQAWTQQVADVALSGELSEEQRIEAVFVLSEIPTDEACEALAQVVAQTDGPSEIRAAAAWGITQGVQPRPELLLPYAADGDDLVALHAIVGLPSLSGEAVEALVEWLRDGTDRQAAVAAHLLARHELVQPLLEAVRQGDQARLWALRALGDLDPELVRETGGELLTAEIGAVLEPLWVGQSDWLRGEAADGIDALDIQKVRFDPLL